MSGEKFYCDKCAALFYGSHYRQTSGRHCESAENNEAEMQFTLALRQSKLESESLLPLSQIYCRLKKLNAFNTIILNYSGIRHDCAFDSMSL